MQVQTGTKGAFISSMNSCTFQKKKDLYSFLLWISFRGWPRAMRLGRIFDDFIAARSVDRPILITIETSFGYEMLKSLDGRLISRWVCTPLSKTVDRSAYQPLLTRYCLKWEKFKMLDFSDDTRTGISILWHDLPLMYARNLTWHKRTYVGTAGLQRRHLDEESMHSFWFL